ncbi:MAG: OmpA family protein [Prevotella sp.]|nr:OmpA family protein [Prevotella sp.]
MYKVFSSLVVLFLLIVSTGTVNAQTSLEQRILYQPDSVSVRESQHGQLEMMAAYMKSHPDANVIVAGFVSPLTTPSRRDYVAQERANQVARMLSEQYGIDSARLIPIGVGIGKRYVEQEFNEVVSFFRQ